MHPWFTLSSTPVDDDSERDMTLNYFRAYIPSMSPREALQPLISKFRRLEYLNRPPWAGMAHELIYEDSPFYPPSRDHDEVGLMLGREWLALRHLREIYLDCGWNVDAVVQTAFRREEFLEERRRYLDEVYYRDNVDGIRRQREL
jgi:hypothetical protein